MVVDRAGARRADAEPLADGRPGHALAIAHRADAVGPFGVGLAAGLLTVAVGAQGGDGDALAGLAQFAALDAHRGPGHADCVGLVLDDAHAGRPPCRSGIPVNIAVFAAGRRSRLLGVITTSGRMASCLACRRSR